MIVDIVFTAFSADSFTEQPLRGGMIGLGSVIGIGLATQFVWLLYGQFEFRRILRILSLRENEGL